MAALSRQLATRRVDLRDGGPIEVGIVAGGDGADVYASAGALTAISRAFANPPVAAKVENLPHDVVWILHDGEKQFLGRGDVLSKIIPEPTEPLYTQRTSVGVVKFWRDDKGYGVIETPETKPWGIWCSFGSIEPTGGIATLPSGEQFPVTYDEDGRAYHHLASRWSPASSQAADFSPLRWVNGSRCDIIGRIKRAISMSPGGYDASRNDDAYATARADNGQYDSCDSDPS